MLLLLSKPVFQESLSFEICYGVFLLCVEFFVCVCLQDPSIKMSGNVGPKKALFSLAGIKMKSHLYDDITTKLKPFHSEFLILIVSPSKAPCK